MTETADLMREIVASIAPELRAAGFKKRRYLFNRPMTDGLVHVVYFWMGAFDPSGKHAVPGLIPDYHGTFTIRVGVHVPAMRRLGSPKTEWVNEYNCQLRWAIGELLPAGRDVWWELQYPGIVEVARTALFGPGLSKLAEFPDENAVLRAFESGGARALDVWPAGPLDISEVYRSRGDFVGERRTLEDYTNQIVEQGASPGHIQVLRKFLVEQGYGGLANLLD